MLEWQNHLLSVTLLIFFTPTFSGADNSENPVINCYQCHSKYDEDCKQISVNSSVYLKPCDESGKYSGQTPFCRKIFQKILGWEEKEVTVRKCGWIRDHSQECYRVRNWDHSETVCQCFTDRCNTGFLLQRSLTLLLLLSILHKSLWFS